MDRFELMKARHSVRRYLDKPLSAEAVGALNEEIAACNEESGLHIQLVTNEPEAFQAEKPEYGKIRGCRNYLALVGPKGVDERIGYFGEKVVLKAQELGVNSCWVALTYKKGKADVRVAPGEKLYMVIALGYGETQGSPRKSKSAAEVSDCREGDPEWYHAGIEAALLAPTAVNQQKFRFERNGEKVKAKAGLGFYSKVDLGIVKYHFELGAEKDGGVWE
ncbi:MAG: nitroreductase [Clostridia bacterium]|nr:nitroreductase [Clostridia bacterium]